MNLSIRRTRRWLERRSRPDAGVRYAITPVPTPGINVVGYLRAELGIGELARRLIAGIDRAGIPCSTITYDNTVSRQEFPFEERGARTAPYDTNIVCINADQLHEFARSAGRRFFSDRYTVGVWFWELETFPERFHAAFDLVDEVWVASDFVRSSLGSVTSKPVNVVPLPLQARPAEPIARTALGLPESFLFLFTFDYMSIVERKNPLGLIAAFKQAFNPGDGAALVVKSMNGGRDVANLERVQLASAGRPDIHVLDGYLSPEVKDGLIAACDCYVSLHRSEGLGLTMAEAMSYGRPVIATGYSGNLTFMDGENSYLVPHAMTVVPPDCHPYTAGACWAAPDVDRAASLMRHVFEHQDEARARGARARRDMVTRHSAERTAEFVTRRLDEIHRLP